MRVLGIFLCSIFLSVSAFGHSTPGQLTQSCEDLFATVKMSSDSFERLSKLAAVAETNTTTERAEDKATLTVQDFNKAWAEFAFKLRAQKIKVAARDEIMPGTQNGTETLYLVPIKYKPVEPTLPKTTLKIRQRKYYRTLDSLGSYEYIDYTYDKTLFQFKYKDPFDSHITRKIDFLVSDSALKEFHNSKGSELSIHKLCDDALILAPEQSAVINTMRDILLSLRRDLGDAAFRPMRYINYHRRAFIIIPSAFGEGEMANAFQAAKNSGSPFNFQITVDEDTEFLDENETPVGEYPHNMRVVEVKYPRVLLDAFLKLDAASDQDREIMLDKLEREVQGLRALYNFRLQLSQFNDPRYDGGHGKLHQSFKPGALEN